MEYQFLIIQKFGGLNEIWKKLFIAMAIMCLSSGQIFSQTMNISYNIPMFSHGGSFSVNLGSQLNKSTNESENVIKIMDSEGKLVKIIDIETLDNMLNIIKEKVNTYSGNKQTEVQIVTSTEKIITNLEALKERLVNTKQSKNVLQKSGNANSISSSFQWNYTIQTIRDVSIPMNGSLDW